MPAGLDHEEGPTARFAGESLVRLSSYLLLRGGGALQEWGYVACTRARAETHLYLTAETHEGEARRREPARLNAAERAARALMVSVSEPLALEQAGALNNSTTRAALAAREQQLEQARASAAVRLAQAEAKLDRLRWRGRPAQRAELRVEIKLAAHRPQPGRGEARPATHRTDSSAHARRSRSR